jgi:hypothetical protein
VGLNQHRLPVKSIKRGRLGRACAEVQTILA